MQDGDGARIKRLFPINGLRNIDPFVLFDEFLVDKGGFPLHPHRGFEAITYMLEGSFSHKDNFGNEGEIEAGEAQMFTAGKGMKHSEMPGTKGMNRGFQIWINLPKKLKQIDPAYAKFSKEQLPVQEFAGGKVRTVVGQGSPLILQTEALVVDVELNPDNLYKFMIPQEFVGLIYVHEGDLNWNDKILKAGEALVLPENSELVVSSETRSKFLILSGKPHKETIYQHGPYVD